MTRTLVFEPYLSPALLLSALSICIVVLAIYARTRPYSHTRRRWAAVITLMSLGMSIVFVILLNPTWLETIPPPAGKPLLTIAIDSSASMATADAPGGRTRFDQAARTARSIAELAQGQFDVRVVSFDSDTRDLDLQNVAQLEPSGEHTDLGGVINRALQADRQQGQAVVLLSDGIHNQSSSAKVFEAARAAKSMAVPIYTSSIGGEATVRDLAISVQSPQALAFIGQVTPINVAVAHKNLHGTRATVVLRNEKGEVARTQAVLNKQGASEVHFEVFQDDPGLYRYEVEVEPFHGETSLFNNKAVYMLRVVDQPIRVLLLEGKPYWDLKFLMRTLAADASIEVDSIIKMAHNRFLWRSLRTSREELSSTAADTTDVSGSRVEQWDVLADPSELMAGTEMLNQYHILIVGRNAEDILSDDFILTLRNWVAKEGGAVVCYRGAPMSQISARLERLMPVQWSPATERRFHLRLTEQGNQIRWFGTRNAQQDQLNGLLAELPTLATSSTTTQPKLLATILAVASLGDDEMQPVVTYQPYGMGCVVAIEGAGMWRWAFPPAGFQQHEGFFQGMWRSMLRWLASRGSLMPGEDFALQADKVAFTPREEASASLLTREELSVEHMPLVELSSDQFETIRQFAPTPLGDEPGTYRISFGRLLEGSYKARLQLDEHAKGPNTEIAFDVRRYSNEQVELGARPDIMMRIANESGGMSIAESSPEDFLAHFRLAQEKNRPERIRRSPAWDRWWSCLAVLGVWCCSWSVRRSGGLI